VELGYYLSQDACGRGVARKACRWLVNYVFDAGAHRIGLRIASDNLPSIKLAERLGFRREGCLREADVFQNVRRDVFLYGLLRTEWPRQPDGESYPTTPIVANIPP
jgi:ribosomal-protein-serine acetyltransferase